MAEKDLKYKIAFASIRGMGYELAQRILDILPSEKAFFSLKEEELKDVLQVKSRITASDYRSQLLQMAEREIDFINQNNIGYTYFSDNDYPTRLTNAPDAPIMMYYKGDISCLNANKAISIVGTRHATTYGQHFCCTLVKDIADQLIDTVIISGLAYGIDISAHRAAIDNDVPTVAVLAHGLNMIYPSQHRNDAIKILDRDGLLLTDYTSQAVVSRANFLARNRIVAGLSDCTIVVESAEKGGAMTTASIAASYDRDVFAVPGKVSDIYSAGCNNLIRDNKASLITCCEDLAKAMRWDMFGSESQPRQKTLFPEISPEERPIIDYLRCHSDAHINTICTSLKIPMAQLLNLLIDLEFKGIVLTSPGNKYSMA